MIGPIMRVPTETDQAVSRRAFTRRQRFAPCAVGLAIALASWPAPLCAEVQISVYGGANENFSSRASVEKSPVSDSRTLDWDGDSFQMPPYWGARGTYWLNPGSSWGIALDYTHAKAYAKLNFATDPTYSHLEFTDGLNLLTLNLLYRFVPLWGSTLTPYVGVGAGLSIPHVEVGLNGATDLRVPTHRCGSPSLCGSRLSARSFLVAVCRNQAQLCADRC